MNKSGCATTLIRRRPAPRTAVIMDTPSCRSCGYGVRETDRFCPSCGSQLLLADQQEAVTPRAPGQMNTLDYRETAKSRTLSLRFTDMAMERVGSSVTAMLGTVVPLHDSRSPDRPPTGVIDGISAVRTAQASTPNTASIQALEAETDEERLRRVFRFEDDGVRLDETDFKAVSKKDAVKRITYTFLLAQEVTGVGAVPRKDVNAVLTEASLLDSNARAWLNNEPNLERDATAKTLRLKAPSRREARVFLSDVLDPTVEGVFQPGQQPRKRTARHTRSADHGQGDGTAHTVAGSKAGAASRNVADWLPKWEVRQRELGLDKASIHRVLAGASLADRAIVVLWAIREAVGDEGKEVGCRDLSQFSWEAFETKIDPRNAQKALQGKAASGKVEKVHGTAFQLLPPGKDRAESLVNPSGAVRTKVSTKAR